MFCGSPDLQLIGRLQNGKERKTPPDATSATKLSYHVTFVLAIT